MHNLFLFQSHKIGNHILLDIFEMIPINWWKCGISCVWFKHIEVKRYCIHAMRAANSFGGIKPRTKQITERDLDIACSRHANRSMTYFRSHLTPSPLWPSNDRQSAEAEPICGLPNRFHVNQQLQFTALHHPSHAIDAVPRTPHHLPIRPNCCYM